MKLKIFSLILGVFCVSGAFSTVRKDSATMAPFGKVHLYIPDSAPESVTIMISGDGGWKYGVVDFSEHFAAQKSLVIGVDILQYYKNLIGRSEECYHIATDFIELASTVEKQQNMPKYQEPVLMGYSSGATLVYALLAQARPNSFKGGISLGFCPDVELPKHFCEINGLKQHPLTNGKSFDLDPDSQLGNRWIVLQGKLDKICDFQNTLDFINKTSDAELISLDKVGHGFSNWADFMPQWDKAFQSLFDETKLNKPDSSTSVKTTTIKDLPIVITPAKTNKTSAPMALLISGDGGWYGLEQNICNHLASAGVPAIGIDSRKYFWNRRSPQETAQDFVKIYDHFSEEWKKDTILLIGYSMGAEVIPFIFEQLPKEIQLKTKAMVLLSPDSWGDFQIHITNMIGLGNSKNTYDVTAELKKVSSHGSILIITGDSENSTLPTILSATNIVFATVPGNHHYKSDSFAIFNVLKNKNLLQ
jgi:type IV secretory pathway VirJ component